jgi:hypothetical protein
LSGEGGNVVLEPAPDHARDPVTLAIHALQQQPAASGDAVMLYRGVRGKLPASFYEPDVQGFITAVDFAFQSTSTDREVTIAFMAPNALNVLWVMHCSHGSDSAGQLHNGAVLQFLSQFPAEAETLLPPLCMLQVLRINEGDDASGFRITHGQKGCNKKNEAVVYTEIHVRPWCA